MVDGVARFQARMRRIPANVRTAATKQVEKEAGKIVALMDILNPLPGTISIGWDWDAATVGASSAASSGMAVEIRATARTASYPGGFPAIARWWEFGTGPRVQKSTGRYVGRIHAQPYFYPAYRAERTRVRGNIRAAVRRAIRKS